MAEGGSSPAGGNPSEIVESVTRHLAQLSGARKKQFQRDLANRLGIDTSIATWLFGAKNAAPSLIAVLVIILVFISVWIILMFSPTQHGLITALISLASTALGIAIGRHFG